MVDFQIPFSKNPHLLATQESLQEPFVETPQMRPTFDKVMAVLVFLEAAFITIP